MGDQTVMELVKHVAEQGQQIVDLLRRVATLEAMFWAVMLLLVANLVTNVATYRRATLFGKEEILA